MTLNETGLVAVTVTLGHFHCPWPSTRHEELFKKHQMNKTNAAELTKFFV